MNLRYKSPVVFLLLKWKWSPEGAFKVMKSWGGDSSTPKRTTADECMRGLTFCSRQQLWQWRHSASLSMRVHVLYCFYCTTACTTGTSKKVAFVLICNSSGCNTDNNQVIVTPKDRLNYKLLLTLITRFQCELHLWPNTHPSSLPSSRSAELFQEL